MWVVNAIKWMPSCATGTKHAQKPLIVNKNTSVGGPHSTMDSVLASHPVAPCLILGVSKDLFLTENNYLDVAEINRQHCTALC